MELHPHQHSSDLLGCMLCGFFCTGYRDTMDTGVFVMEQVFFLFVVGWLQTVSLPTELIKSHDFFWCQMWDVTLKWTTVSTGFRCLRGMKYGSV